MAISKEQISMLLDMVSSVSPDGLDCDGCFQHVAEFADAQLSNREIPEALKAVGIHLEQCKCCKDEYLALQEALKAMT